MISPWLVFSERAYRALLRAYPAGFRGRFAPEMAQVFGCLCREVYRREGAPGVLLLWLQTLPDWARGVVVQWWLCWFKPGRGTMEAWYDRQDGVRPLPAFQAALGALPFLLFGLAVLAGKTEVFEVLLAGRSTWLALPDSPYLIYTALILLGLEAGLLTGFPRWAYAYLGWLLLLCALYGSTLFFGYGLFLLPQIALAVILLVTLLARRTLAPVRALFAGLWREWTLLSLSIYIFYAYLLMIFDENHHPNLLLLIVLTTLASGAGAWGYFRARSPVRRVLALMGGLLAGLLISTYGFATWDYAAYYNLPRSDEVFNWRQAIAYLILLAVVFIPGLLALWRGSRRKPTSPGVM